MASGDQASPPKYMTYSKSSVPVVGALIDYLDTSFGYLLRKSFNQAEVLHERPSKSTLSTPFLAAVCMLLGLSSNIKFEVVRNDGQPLPNDLHFMLMSKEDTLYVDDVDTSLVMWCIEASDCFVVVISCLLILNSSSVRSPLSEYLFLPWVGASLRGLLMRQAPTAGALLYTMVMVDGNVNALFLTAFSFFFLMEARMWLEIVRVLRMRWERRDRSDAVLSLAVGAPRCELETLWSSEDVQSVEVHNYVY